MQSLTVNGNIVSSTSDRAAVLCQQFQQRCSAFPPVTSRFFSKNDSSGISEFKEISSIEALTALRKLPSGKSVGLDLVNNGLLKLCACSAVCSSLAKLFNMSLSQGSFPAVHVWKSAIIRPIQYVSVIAWVFDFRKFITITDVSLQAICIACTPIASFCSQHGPTHERCTKYRIPQGVRWFPSLFHLSFFLLWLSDEKEKL